LFLPNANLNPGFQTCIASAGVFTSRPRVLVRAPYKRQFLPLLQTQITLQNEQGTVQTTVLAVVADTDYVTERTHHTLPKATDNIWCSSL